MAPLLCTSDESHTEVASRWHRAENEPCPIVLASDLLPLRSAYLDAGTRVTEGTPTFTGHERRVRHVCGSPAPITACPAHGLELPVEIGRQVGQRFVLRRGRRSAAGSARAARRPDGVRGSRGSAAC